MVVENANNQTSFLKILNFDFSFWGKPHLLCFKLKESLLLRSLNFGAYFLGYCTQDYNPQIRGGSVEPSPTHKQATYCVRGSGLYKNMKYSKKLSKTRV